MRLIDLTLPITDGMPVYPGDPGVSVRQSRFLSVHGFRLHEVGLGSHSGTHVNAPWHMAEKGARLEELPLTRFVARAVVRSPVPRVAPGPGGGRPSPIPPETGLVYADAALDEAELPLVLAARPPFIAQAVEFPLDEGVERALCEAGIVSFENLANTRELPRGEAFLFVGLPLAIGGDGAPVRAVAVLGGI